MPESLGSTTKTLFLKQENHKLSEEFEVKELTSTLTVSADLIEANSTTVTVNGVSTTATVYGTNHGATMAVIAGKVAALAGVASCTAAARVLTIQMTDQTVAPTVSATTLLGNTQPTWTAATDNNTIYPGQQVILTTDGKVEPAADGGSPHLTIGYSIHQGYGEELVTVVMKANTIIWAENKASNHTAGPSSYDAFNTTTSRSVFDDDTITISNYAGWSLDAASDANSAIRVALL